MAAAVVSGARTLRERPWLIRTQRLSVMTDAQAETLTHGGPSGVIPDDITFTIATQADTPVNVNLTRTAASDSTTNGTSVVTFEGSGALTGMVVDVYFIFYGGQPGGGIG